LISSLDRYRHVNAMYSVHWGRWSKNLPSSMQHLPQGENELYSCTLTALLKAKITSLTCEQICVTALIWFDIQDYFHEVPFILHETFEHDFHKPCDPLTWVVCVWLQNHTDTRALVCFVTSS
jgi:hypothetical protein